ncbi:hypothetical protein P872_25540 [Rhodonellum psychrophilum GCM71 = DSM 17998]|uniref:Uncharacterized protein n=1 Tax=Rhodonellum psychrophilum GCM71 = DSM 17998 TaxID=1123057 RepID=U5C387_9BACT|nr:hypothetical protein P872_25540 [Rhodonellum psychrophilum GCM71 = DSM 17998]
MSTFNKIKIQHSIRKNQFSSQFLIQNRGVKAVFIQSGFL